MVMLNFLGPRCIVCYNFHSVIIHFAEYFLQFALLLREVKIIHFVILSIAGELFGNLFQIGLVIGELSHPGALYVDGGQLLLCAGTSD